ncbi:hypothetical protein ACIQVE_22315 [Pseudomonas sp. NPDC098747]|uniref:hypothetical protein n=1 Tax=Pseudomonas sp. NPDC098747 TaxID=3364487 RepID=UPI00383B83C3
MSAVAHVGVERFDKATQAAIDLSADARRQITGSQFIKYIIDNYADEAKAKLREEILKERSKSDER